MSSIWWVRRDLRLNDNPTLQESLSAGPVLPVFIFDAGLFERASEARRNFLTTSLQVLNRSLQERGSYLVIRRGDPGAVLRELLAETGADRIFAEEDYTPYARKRDAKIAADLPLTLIPGQLVHAPGQVLKADGTPYTVFTPFSKVWKKTIPPHIAPIPVQEQIATIDGIRAGTIPEAPEHPDFPAGEMAARQRLDRFLADGVFAYQETRNRYDLEGTSRLSPYLHFGLLSLRTAVFGALQAMRQAEDQERAKSAEIWLNELIWREFYVHILYHFPYVLKRSFRSQYDRIRWANDEGDFAAWKAGQTGFPVVDAAMRQLKETGWMHNRLRMIVASFLVKNLLVDWRWGEQWFMENLVDGDVAANNGGWQWTAGTGTDAAPYFRVFNPVLQSKKFDPEGEFIRKWIPKLAHLDAKVIHAPWEKMEQTPGYPEPIIDLKFSRERALAVYGEVKGS
jgi:deoxyribodipyrimidine photo-lyase